MSKEKKKQKGNMGTTIGYSVGSIVRIGEGLWTFYLIYFLTFPTTSNQNTEEDDL